MTLAQTLQQRLDALRTALRADDAAAAAELAAALEAEVCGGAAALWPAGPAVQQEVRALLELASARRTEVLRLRERLGRARGASCAYRVS